MPYGISNGFVSITLPFYLTRAGFSVAAAASIVALGISSNIWLFLWGPVVDLTFTPRRWYVLAVIIAAISLFLLGVIPFQQSAIGLLTVMVFISEVAVTLLGVHYPKELAVGALSLAMIATAAAIYFTADFRVIAGKGFRERMRLSGERYSRHAAFSDSVADARSHLFSHRCRRDE